MSNTDRSTTPPESRQADLFHALAHPVRLQILDVLRGGEVCVCDLQAALGLRQAHISQHLMELRRAGLVANRKDGPRVYYRAADLRLYSVLVAAGEYLRVPGSCKGESDQDQHADED